jgi:hypothetical protein
VKKAFLLGAGASRGTVDAFRVPVASEFGEVLAALDPSWNAHYPALVSAIGHLGLDPNHWPLEPVWSCLDFYAKLQPALPLPKPWRDESWQVKGALLAVYGRRCDAEAEKTPGDSTLAHLFRTQLQKIEISARLAESPSGTCAIPVGWFGWRTKRATIRSMARARS